MLAVVVPGGAAGLAEHSSGLAAGDGPGASYSVTQEPDGSYRATLAAGDQVYAKTPTLLPADETGASGVLASQARSERTEPLGTGIVTIFPDSPMLDNCVPFGMGDPGPDLWRPYAAFIYKDVPPFVLDPNTKDILAFDLGRVNDADIELDIAMARTTTNGGDQEAEPFVTVAHNTQTPANPRGNTTVGDFELLAHRCLSGGGHRYEWLLRQTRLL